MATVPLWLIALTTSLAISLGVVVGWLLATMERKGQHR